MKKRLAWAKKHEQRTLDRWKYVLSSDESKFEIFGSNRHVFVRGKVGERMIYACVLHQMTWPPQSSDLNPNERVWEQLNRRVKQPTSAQRMWKLLEDCWKSIPGEAG